MTTGQSQKKNIKSMIKTAGRKTGTFYKEHPVLFTLCLAFAVAFFAEILGRHSLIDAVVFVFTKPVRFLVNVSIVFFTVSLSLLFKRRLFFTVLFATVWFGLGVANAIVLIFRTTPLGVIDIMMLPSVISIMTVYFNIFGIILIIAVILLALAGLVVLFIKSPKEKPVYRPAVLCVLIGAVCAGATYGYTVITGREEREDTFANISEAYSDYGFVYCFSTGAVDRGIDKPKDYCELKVDVVTKALKKESPAPNVMPDIIFVQLESFFDVGYLDDVWCEENPIPNFTKLKEKYSSGFLTVPSVGAGTANTEFEILSGMSLDFFGMGEYPYKTILQEKACETVATNLKDLGYTAHALHNNTGTFYGRDEVFSQLGFDTFTSLEYMQGVTYNPIGWANDSVLVDEILKVLDSTEARDFVFAITVQGHGKYKGAESDELLDVEWEDVSPENEAAFEYYASQLKEVDAFVGELTEAVKSRGKPAVIVFYGDHLPNFDIGSAQLENGDVFETEYVIWNNMGLEVNDEDLNAYQLSAEILQRVGVDRGILTRYHQQKRGSEDYLSGLEVLEYDMLYGAGYCYDEKGPYEASPMEMGSVPISVSGCSWENGVLTVEGKNFTEWSTVYLNDDRCETEFISSEELRVECDEPERGDCFCVGQVAENSTVLSYTEQYILE